MGDRVDADAPERGGSTPPPSAWLIALGRILPGLKRWLAQQHQIKRVVGVFGFESDRPHYQFMLRPAFGVGSLGPVEAELRELLARIEEVQAEGFAQARAEGCPHALESETLVEFFVTLPSVDEGAPGRASRGPLAAVYQHGELTFADP